MSVHTTFDLGFGGGRVIVDKIFHQIRLDLQICLGGQNSSGVVPAAPTPRLPRLNQDQSPISLLGIYEYFILVEFYFGD